ncbi:MAG: DUF456 domain-containing protein [Phycisphaerales bacterium JB043]
MLLIVVTLALFFVWVVSCALTLLSFSGVWLTIAGALSVQLVWPETYSWWTIAAVIAVCAMGELFEIFGSAAGARRSGGTRTAAIGSVIGGIGGAIAGTVFIPIPVVGTILGAIVGAGAMAMLGQRASSPDSWADSARVGRAAAKARFLALLVKGLICLASGVVLLGGLWL